MQNFTIRIITVNTAMAVPVGGRDRGNSELWYFQIHEGIIRFTKGTLISNSALSFKLKQKSVNCLVYSFKRVMETITICPKSCSFSFVPDFVMIRTSRDCFHLLLFTVLLYKVLFICTDFSITLLKSCNKNISPYFRKYTCSIGFVIHFR